MLLINTVLSRRQQLPGEGAEIYRPNDNHELLKLYSEFYWNYNDIITYYQIVAGRLHDIDREIDDAHKELREKYSKIDFESLDEEEIEMYNFQFSRSTTGLRDKDLELRSSAAFQKNYFIIGLWAMVEQFMGKTLRIGEQHINASYLGEEHKWHKIVKRFNQIGVDLKVCKGYSNIDECRVLNNKIKHVGVVDHDLTGYPYFSSFVGKDLNNIDFELQRYTDSVFEFVGNVMEELDSKITQ